MAAIKLCLSMILCNSEETIERVLLSWKPHVNDIIVVLNNSTDKTEEILVKHRVKVYKSKFLGFAKTRNLCLSYCQQYDFNFHMDDSYELIGDLKDTERLKNVQNPINIRIESAGVKYVSCRVLPKGCNAKYVGVIHETLDKKPYETLNGCHINDIQSEQGTVRSFNRLNDDYRMLKDLCDPRSKFYLAMTLIQLFNAKACGVDFLLEALQRRICDTTGNLEENFICCIYFAAYCDRLEMRLRMLVTASVLFPKRRAEAFILIYELNGSMLYLEKAYIAAEECIKNEYFTEFCVPYSTSIYTETIPLSYREKFVKD